jgi:LemA protein
MSTHAIVAIVGAAVLAFWVLGAHNRLVRLRQTLAAAFAHVDAQLRLRHDLLGELIEAAAAAEPADATAALVAVDAARQQTRIAADRAARRPGSAGRLASLVLAEQVLQSALPRLIALVEARQAHGDDPTPREGLTQLSAAQAGLAAAGQAFNAAVLDYNRNAQQFPTRLVAAMFGFRAAGTL